MKILDVGCGNNKTPGAIGIDANPDTQADVIHDLNRYPYPFPASEFDLIYCRHIIEHLDDVVAFIEELYRIAVPNATIHIVTPHFTNRFSYTDPTHRHHFSALFTDYFVEQPKKRASILSRALETSYPLPDFYSQVRFEKVSSYLRFGRPFRLTGIQWLANRFINFYELYLAFIFPARDLYITLKVIK